MENKSNDELDLQKSTTSNINENINSSSNNLSIENHDKSEDKNDIINIEKVKDEYKNIDDNKINNTNIEDVKNDNAKLILEKDKDKIKEQININKIEDSKKEINKDNEYNTGSENLLNYSDLKPLNLVDCVEKKYNLFLPSSKENYIINQLELFKSNNTIKNKVLEFNDKKGITEKLLQNSSNFKFKCFKISEDYLFGADDQGTIHVLLLDKQYEINQFPLEKVEKNLKKIQVTSMDVSEKAEFLVIGYSNGYIALFEVNKQKLIYLIKETSKTQIVSIKFLNVTNGEYEFIYSNLIGLVNKSIISKGFFKTNVTEENICKDINPTYALELYKPNPDLTLLAIANFEEIRIYIVKKEKSYLFDTKKIEENNEKNEYIIDISFGLGYTPLNNTNYIFQNNEEELENIKEKLLLAASYKNIIRLYSFDIQKGKDDTITINANNKGKEIAYFVNDKKIIRIGFICNSILYFFDLNEKECLIKVINTFFMKSGEYNEKYNKSKKDEKINESNLKKIIKPKENINNEEEQKPLLEEGLSVDNILNKTSLSYIKDDKIYKNFYRNFIFHKENTIYFFAKQRFYLGKLLNFAECFADFEKNQQWIEALCLGINLYQQKIILLPHVPIQPKKRKELLLPLLKELLNRYIDYNFKQKDNNDTDDSDSDIYINENEEKLKNCMNISIEFCVGINEILFLLMDVYTTFNLKGKSDAFIKSIEPFIYSGQLSNANISNAIPFLFSPYKTNDELGTFSHLLIYLNFESINQQVVKLLCFNSNLFITLIYLYSNGTDYREFFLPIVRMYNYYLSKENEDNQFLSYIDLYKKIGLNKMQFSKEYILHKLMWYIDLSLNKKKFFILQSPKDSFYSFDSEDENYKKFVLLIYAFLLDEKTFLKIVYFDSYSFFLILSKFFTEKHLYKIIKDKDFNNITNEYNIIFKQLSEIKVPEALDKIIKEKVKEKKEEKKVEENKNEEKKDEENKNEEKKEEEKKEEEKKDEEIKNEEKKEVEIKEDEKKDDEKKKIEKEELNEEKKEKKINDFVLTDNIKSTLNKIISTTLRVQKFFVEQNLNMFIIKCATKLGKGSIESNKVIHSLKNIFHYFKNLKETKENDPEEAKDIFKCYGNEEIDLKNKGSYYYEILQNLDNFFKSGYTFEKEELDDLIDSINHSPFLLIKIKLLEMKKDYLSCLSFFIENINQIDSHNIFEWINSIFLLIQKEDNNKEEEFENIQKAILEKLPQLSKISIDKTIKIIDNWFSDNQKTNIIKKLENDPEVQYQFLQKILNEQLGAKENENKEKSKEKRRNSFLINPDDKNLSELVLLEIQLLIKLNKKDKILDTIKDKISYYSLKELLDLCLSNNIFSAAIYLYEISGDSKSALALTIKEFNFSCDDLFSDKDKIEKDKLDKFNTNLNLCIRVCESYSESNKDTNSLKAIKEGYDLWFEILKNLYQFRNKCVSMKNVQKIISDAIKDLLTKMCIYVSINEILDYITKENKDVEFKEFKHILIGMIKSYNNFSNFLKDTKIIFSNSISKQNLILEKKYKSGNGFNVSFCDLCNKGFNKDENDIIIAFKCGHKYHIQCVKKDNICILCEKNEIIPSNLYVAPKTFSKIIISKESNKKEFWEKNKMNKLKMLDKEDWDKNSLVS